MTGETNISLIPMTSRHIDAVALIEEKSFSVPWAKTMFSEIAENPISHFYVAVTDENEICGFAGMYVIGDESQILNIAVSPDFRRCGIGKKLLHKLIDECEKLNVVMILLEVRESNTPAKNLYKSFGFELCGKRKKYYTNPVEDALVLSKVLN